MVEEEEEEGEEGVGCKRYTGETSLEVVRSSGYGGGKEGGREERGFARWDNNSSRRPSCNLQRRLTEFRFVSFPVRFEFWEVSLRKFERCKVCVRYIFFFGNYFIIWKSSSVVDSFVSFEFFKSG